jgi:[acyl-carrier-protein] S-malonyltransferase
MSKLACLFPGQGSQSVGMGKDLFEKLPQAKAAFAEIDKVAGRSLSTLCFDGPEDELKRTVNTQPTILAVSLVAWRCYEAAGGRQPDFVAGHSLGELTALVVAGALSVEGAVQLVAKRSRLMEECPKGAMSAVIGMSPEDLESVCKQATDEQRAIGSPDTVIIANFNTREQLVISGSPEAVLVAAAKAKAKGARVISLPVGGAFHSPLMLDAAKEFEEELGKWTLNDARFAVIQNLDAKPAQKADVLKHKLSKQIPSAVRWAATIEYMLAQDVTDFVEIGPGKALAGMVRKMTKDARVFNVFDDASLKETLTELRSTAGAQA